ncbi:MAG: hypothetical protein JW895_14965 [Thermoleophilaceae bacterium]|nr:hypothetical protein [Thermoleophilaceae bacterium]
MCMQCMAAATTAAAGATGARSWLATRSWAWLTARRLKIATGGLMFVALTLSATGTG